MSAATYASWRTRNSSRSQPCSCVNITGGSKLYGGGIDEIDLIAIDIRRESDVGLATLNGTRRAIGLKPYADFSELTSDLILQSSFQSLYGSIEEVDLFMGGLA